MILVQLLSIHGRTLSAKDRVNHVLLVLTCICTIFGTVQRFEDMYYRYSAATVRTLAFWYELKAGIVKSLQYILHAINALQFWASESRVICFWVLVVSLQYLPEL